MCARKSATGQFGVYAKNDKCRRIRRAQSPRWCMGLYQLAEIRWSGCGPHLESVQPVYRWPVASPEASVASEVKQCTFVSLLQWNLACDILMTLAIKRVQNLPPHLSYVSTLPNITQKLKTWHWRAEALTPGTVFLRALSTKPSGKHGCMHV